MKKTLLAAALLAGFATAGVAQAETSVTLYGIVDTGYSYSQSKLDHKGVHEKSTSSGLSDGTFTGMAGSRWGLRGSEDLGDGLRAIFTLEQGFNLGNGKHFGDEGRTFHRQAFVGLTSDNWGTFSMGRQYSVGASYIYGMLIGGFGIADAGTTSGGIDFGNRMSNSFKYETPNFSGFQAAIMYGSDDAGKTIYRTNQRDAINKDERKHWLSTGLKYQNGPLVLAATYERKSDTYYGTRNRPLSTWNLAASYDFEVVKVALAYGQERNAKFNSGNNYGYDNFKANNWNLSLTAPLGGGNLGIGWQHSRSNLGDVKNIDEKKINIYAVNYSYPLSKRTAVYAYANYGTGIASDLGYLYQSGTKTTQAGIGLNHRF